MLMHISHVDTQHYPKLVDALIHVLNQRRHTRVVLGEEVIVEGSLSKALKLPELLKQLRSKQEKRRLVAEERFCVIWETLSEDTKQQALDHIGWYAPNELNWDDPRSNRKPSISDDD